MAWSFEYPAKVQQDSWFLPCHLSGFPGGGNRGTAGWFMVNLSAVYVMKEHYTLP
jgi:hypothetical protein